MLLALFSVQKYRAVFVSLTLQSFFYNLLCFSYSLKVVEVFKRHPAVTAVELYHNESIIQTVARSIYLTNCTTFVMRTSQFRILLPFHSIILESNLYFFIFVLLTASPMSTPVMPRLMTMFRRTYIPINVRDHKHMGVTKLTRKGANKSYIHSLSIIDTYGFGECLNAQNRID